MAAMPWELQQAAIGAGIALPPSSRSENRTTLECLSLTLTKVIRSESAISNTVLCFSKYLLIIFGFVTLASYIICRVNFRF